MRVAVHRFSDDPSYERSEVTGGPVSLMVRGRVVFDDGQPWPELGHGTFLPCVVSGRPSLRGGNRRSRGGVRKAPN